MGRSSLKCFLSMFGRTLMFISFIVAVLQVELSEAMPSNRQKTEHPITTEPKLLKTKSPLAVSAEPREEAPSPGAIESDMILTDEQLSLLREMETDIKHGDERTDGRKLRTRRKAISDVSRLWPRGIVPYEISRSSVPDRSIIETAISHWEDVTCLDFRPYNRRLVRLLRHNNKLVFIKGNGCWSSVGRSQSGAQDISIGEGCAVRGTVIHEIGHAIGFFHEHSRPDRADHIRVHTENVHPRYHHDFRVLGWGRVADRNVPYDTKSIMHYGSHYQSMNGEATITTINPLEQANLGRRDGLSFGDIKLANLIYQCNAHCDLTAVDCMNGGYIGPNCVCICPEEYTGHNCSDFTPQTQRCVELLTDEQGVITSPNFPSAYENNMHCVWHIKGSENMTVEVTVISLSIEGGDGCPYDYLRYLQGDMRPFHQRHCNDSPPSTVTVFLTNEVVIEFQSDQSVTAGGFQLKYQLIIRQENETI